jgi:hypothetical protein
MLRFFKAKESYIKLLFSIFGDIGSTTAAHGQFDHQVAISSLTTIQGCLHCCLQIFQVIRFV